MMGEQPPRSLTRYIKDMKELMTLLKTKGEEVKRKSTSHKNLLKNEIKKQQSVLESVSSADDQKAAEKIVEQKQEMAVLDRDVDQVLTRLAQVEPKVKDAEQELESLRQQQQESKENKQYPRARYAVNLYKDVSNISWHREQRQSGEVKGFIRSKSNVKTFCFNEDKQSRPFICNSLWEMGEDEVW